MAASWTPEEFIRDNLAVEEVAPGLRLYCAHPGSGLWRLRLDDAAGDEDPVPYWAYPWAGGFALARYLAEKPQHVAGKRVLDIGCGGGIAAIAAAKAGAALITAIDIDPYAVAAAKLNAELNGVAITATARDMLDGPAPQAEMIIAGDLFYDAQVARRAFAFLQRCKAAGACVLIGDPYRTYLPSAALRLLQEYAVADVGHARSARTTPAGVFALK